MYLSIDLAVADHIIYHVSLLLLHQPVATHVFNVFPLVNVAAVIAQPSLISLETVK